MFFVALKELDQVVLRSMGKYSRPRRQGRPALWLPGVITKAVEDGREELLLAWRKKNAARLKVWSNYQEFCQLNDFALNDKAAVLAILASWRVSPLARTSIRTSFRHLKSMFFAHARGENVATPSISDLYKISGVDAARQIRRHAIDVSIDVLEDFICNAPRGRLRTVCAFLTLSGLRTCDFEALRLQAHPQVHVASSKFSVDVDVAKNRQDPESRTQLRITSKMAPDLWRDRLVDILLRDRDLLEFRKEDTRDLGAFFAACGMPDSGDRQVTSYTLRRNFCHRAIRYCTNEDGSVDWEKAISFTLHKSVASLKASYAKRITDEPSDDSSEEGEE